MASMSDYLEGQLRTHLFRTGSFTKPTVLAVALLTAASADADTGATGGKEVANAGAYARQTLNPLDANWTAASSTDGLTDNASAITFPVATANWGTITHLWIVDSATYGAGNVLFHGALTSSVIINSGGQLIINVGDLNIVWA